MEVLNLNIFDNISYDDSLPFVKILIVNWSIKKNCQSQSCIKFGNEWARRTH